MAQYIYILTLFHFFFSRRIKNNKYFSSDSDSESSVIDDPVTDRKNDLPPPPRSLVSRVNSGDATTFQESALSTAVTSSTPRSCSVTSSPSRTNFLEDVSIVRNVDQHPDQSKLFCIMYLLMDYQGFPIKYLSVKSSFIVISPILFS